MVWMKINMMMSSTYSNSSKRVQAFVFIRFDLFCISGQKTSVLSLYPQLLKLLT